MKTHFMFLASIFLLLAPARLHAQTDGFGNITAQFSESAQKWETTIKGHAVNLFWILAAIAAVWTFAVLVLKQGDLADLVGASVRYILTTMFFYWILDHGPDLATKIMQSTQQMGNDASGSNGVDYNAFLNTGKDILLGIMGKVNILQPVTATCALVLGLLILIFLCLITLNIMLVTAQTWIIAYAGLIFLAFGASEWTRDMAVGYYKTMLAFGVKLMLTLLLAAIGLDILRGAQIQIGQGIDLVVLIKAMGGSLILLGIVAKAPDCVASIAGVSTGGFGHGIGTFLAAAGMGYQAGSWVSGAAAQGGKQLGSAVRNAVKQGQALSRGK